MITSYSVFITFNVSYKMEKIEEMTAERSLNIIRQSIEQSRRAVMKNAGTPMLIWGILVFCTALIVSYLWMHAGGPKWNYLWFVMTIIGFVITYLMGKKHKHQPVGFVGKVIGYIWITFAIFGTTLPLMLSLGIFGNYLQTVSIGLGFSGLFITSYEVLLMGFSATVSGFILNNKLIVLCGIVSGIGGIFWANLTEYGNQMFVIAGVAVLCLIVPGLIMNSKSKRESL